MIVLKAFEFRLDPTPAQITYFKKTVGCCRFVFNKTLALHQEEYKNDPTVRFDSYKLSKNLAIWKKQEGLEWLNEPFSTTLGDVINVNLNQAYMRFFKKLSKYPRFKKKGENDSFLVRQGFTVEEGNARIKLPKEIGWVKYINHRKITGVPKNLTISEKCGKWYISIQTQETIEDPVHPSNTVVGIDMGIARFATLSDGTVIEGVSALESKKAKLKKLQRRLKHKVKGSKGREKQLKKISKLHHHIANIRKDHIHKATHAISKNHAVVVLEDLKVSNMSKSAKGTIENPGTSVKAKSGLNRRILDQGWGEFRRQLGYKMPWRGGAVVVVPPQYTSQTCPECLHKSKDNRKTQALFECVNCGFSENADLVGARNIIAEGHSVLGGGSAQLSDLVFLGQGKTRHVEALNRLVGAV